MKETQSQGTQQFILGNPKGKNLTKIPQYRLLEYNAQRTIVGVCATAEDILHL